jgi:hypothetical protein
MTDMEDNMRSCILAGLIGLLATGFQTALSGPPPAKPQLHPLEGELRIHPKYLYRYYLFFGDGQTCALYGPDHDREFKPLSGLQPGTRVRVHGALGTYQFPGGTKDNPSPFPRAWVLYMDVHQVEVIQNR